VTAGRGGWRPPEVEPLGRPLFVAVPLPAEAREAVAELVASLPSPGNRRPVRWVRFDGLHVTLRFLGPTPEERVPDLVRAVDTAASTGGPFTVTLAGAGAFPSPARPRAIWLGITDGADEMAGLVRTLGGLLARVGWPAEERPFRPHLTLARADGVRAGPQTARALIAAAAGISVTFPVDRLVLFESQTGGGPARYECVHEAFLSG
jgi:RNA 2',3'-cyclic 3'-phosphodiesterase